MRGIIIVLLASVVWLSPVLAQERMVPEARREVMLSFAPVVKAVTPSVVNIYTRKRVVSRRVMLFDDPFFRRFFGEVPFAGSGQPRIENSLGSGVIVDAAGLVVTNNHVVEGSDDITVVLSDKREFPARIVHTDARTDLAVLQMEAGGRRFPALAFGDSDAVEVGDIVLAIGNPFGVGQTVTSGIVSGLARTTVGVADFRFFIQTDAAINPGNSGGPLVTMDGRMIGINTAIYSRDGGSNGIGFAIPAAMVQTVLRAAQNGGDAKRPWLGASTQTVTFDMVQSLGLEKPEGVIITRLAEHSPAASAGLREGDIVRALDGRVVQDVESLRFRLATLAPEARVTLDVWRDGRSLALPVQLMPPPEIPPREMTKLTGETPLTGATVLNINPAVMDEYSLPLESVGVMIVEVNPRSIARQMGLQPQDIIVSINGTVVATVRDVTAALRARSARWAIQIQRGDQRLQLVIGG